MRYRILGHEEWGRLEDLKPHFQGPIPSQETADVAVAENAEGEIVGLLFIQLAFHMEPLAVDPKARGEVYIPALVKTLETALSERLADYPDSSIPYYAFTPDKNVAVLCKRVGMRQLPYRIWTKIIHGRRSTQEVT